MNPHEIIESPNHQPSLTVWAALGYHGVFAYAIQRESMNGERYCKILTEKVIPNMSRPGGYEWYFQQDGAPPHYCAAARELLDKHLRGRWIGRREPSSGPHAHLNWALWITSSGHTFRLKFINPLVFVFLNLQELQQRIEEEIERVPLSMFRDCLRAFLKRCDKCLDFNGEQFEFSL